MTAAEHSKVWYFVHLKMKTLAKSKEFPHKVSDGTEITITNSAYEAIADLCLAVANSYNELR